ncbi:SCO family protein [Variovorax sp. PCZ-1]|uniref:SCO family protein n=1 Tax=Variovorax sp. PCZ-1 TaxID=2835533 RepID=UPI0020BF4F64|nr:SCO family protein [Variovorax sp. PCZ-1]
MPAICLFCLIFVLLAGCAEKKQEFRSIDITGAEYAKDFALPDVNGQTKTIADFKGKAVVLFFGFAQCPDVCPTTMAEIAEVKKSLGKDGERVTAVFITVDPERDSPQVLKAYMESFDPSFTALRGTVAQTESLAKYYKIYYKKVEGKTPTSYTIDHTAASFIYDPQGKLRLYTRYGMGAQALTDDLKLLLK